MFVIYCDKSPSGVAPGGKTDMWTLSLLSETVRKVISLSYKRTMVYECECVAQSMILISRCTSLWIKACFV